MNELSTLEITFRLRLNNGIITAIIMKEPLQYKYWHFMHWSEFRMGAVFLNDNLSH